MTRIMHLHCTHRNLPESEKSISELFKMYMKSLDSFITGRQKAVGYMI